MREHYLSSINLIERLHRQFLEVVKAELDSLEIDDINNVQALILSNIGTDTLTVGELTYRGYYLGSNVSYNVKKMVEAEYLIQEPSPHDKRASRVRLSDKGLALSEKINAMYARHAEALVEEGADTEAFKDAITTMRELEAFWSSTLEEAGVDLIRF